MMVDDSKQMEAKLELQRNFAQSKLGGLKHPEAFQVK